jgi:hypothetical protein
MTTRLQNKPHSTVVVPPRFHGLPQVRLSFEGSFCVAPLPNCTVTPLAAHTQLGSSKNAPKTERHLQELHISGFLSRLAMYSCPCPSPCHGKIDFRQFCSLFLMAIHSSTSLHIFWSKMTVPRNFAPSEDVSSVPRLYVSLLFSELW